MVLKRMVLSDWENLSVEFAVRAVVLYNHCWVDLSKYFRTWKRKWIKNYEILDFLCTRDRKFRMCRQSIPSVWLNLINQFLVKCKFIIQVKMDIYYESLCPDSIRFISEQLQPLYNEFKKHLQITFLPFGKSSVSAKISFCMIALRTFYFLLMIFDNNFYL